MNLSENVIKAVANIYSVEELETELQKAVIEMLANPEKIISASTGSGASYTKTVSMSASDLVELLTLALEYKKNGFVTSGNNVFRVISAI